MKVTAVFLDRDGTIIEDTGYLKDPDQVRLLPGAAEAIRRLRQVADLVILASNQSGVARGLMDETDLTKVHERLEQLLDEHGANLDGAYYCPYLEGPEATVEPFRRKSDLRKPKPGMLLQASREMSIDLQRSWMIGDSPSDVEAGVRAGCRTIHICESKSPRASGAQEATFTAGSLLEATELLELELNPHASHESASSAPGNGEILEVLQSIRDRLSDAQRQQNQQDFSLMRLFGALLQMFAIVAALWGLTALFDERPDPATARFALAGVLQLGSLSVLLMDRFR